MMLSSLLYGIGAAAITVNSAHSASKAVSYSVVHGIFQQDSNATDASTFNFTASNFGLLDRRSTRTLLQHRFPGFRFERGFKEHDPFWRAMLAEPARNQDARSEALLHDIFTGDASTYISLTSHSGAIASLLRVLRHRPFGLRTGSMIPVLVRVVIQRGQRPPSPSGTLPFEPQLTCATPPASRDPSCNDCSCCV